MREESVQGAAHGQAANRPVWCGE